MIQAGASPDEITAALVKNAQEQTPEGQNPVIGLLSAWGGFFGVPLDVVLSNEQMTPQKAAEIIYNGVPTSEAKLMQTEYNSLKDVKISSQKNLQKIQRMLKGWKC